MDILALLGFFATAFIVASSGAVFRPGPWYEALRKPEWCPPNWLFAPAWSLLYILIAISGWLVWRKVGFAAAAPAFVLYGVQFALNAGWSGIFFGLRRMDIALFELVLLWMSIAATIVAFSAHHAGAAWMLAPYLAWVTFAGVLNYAMVRLNPRDVRTSPRPI
ncbi:TspO/MBR family protein [Humitalea sp. 24SJ18S-53]|uniref:TspO/MBR family protein n=1 Tax=Humitalea sp. 24SJ18S-53 TaxID=3422307 RepID=UPI003D669856